MADLCVVHLLWGPLGTGPIERFAAAYSEYPAGRDHRVLVLFNGFESDTQRADARAALDGIGDEELHLPAPVQDLDAYRDALRLTDAGRFVFLNSYARVLDDGWLGKLAAAHDSECVGLAGASGTWESQLSPAPWPLKPLRVGRFPRFPNPHVRSSAFMLERELGLALDWPRIASKMDAYVLENGRRSITKQVERHGFEAVVVGRDGRAYLPWEYRASRTYRSGGQDNLLVADNRTDDYLAARSSERRRLETIAWGGPETA